MLFAFLGGAILNLMPCVFPVLAIKVLSFLKHGESQRGTVIRNASLYSAGVIISFLFLAGVLLILRGAGEVLGWGFHLQSPAFVFFLLSLMFVMSLNFLGFFEIGSSWMGFGDRLTHGDGPAASFFTGALAVIVATPCTAPFMGTAIGVAITQPAPLMLLVFFFLGAGMALPYFLLATSPSFIKLLPKPGAWMATLKEILAFPLLLTCIWLLWVLVQQTGELGLTMALLGLLVIVFGLWAIKKISSPKIGAAVLFFCLFLGAYLGGWYSGNKAAPGEEIIWEKFSAESVASAKKEGRIVFVNFTAAWCITCKVNERIVFSSNEVRAAVKNRNIALLKADWTNRDPIITQELARHGRAGVPLYLLHLPNSEAAEVLPQVLTPSIFLKALR